jgi:hypothetical protein
MLFALGQPALLLGLLLAYLVGMFVQVWTQRLVIGGRRSLRGVTRPQRWLDPFSAVGALLGGIGWAPRQELDRRRPSLPLLLVVVSVVVEVVLTLVGGVAYKLGGGTRASLHFISTVDVIHGNQFIFTTTFAQKVALGFGIESLACALLCLVPIPPLLLGGWLWSALPRSPGARRLAYHLLEEQWGVAVLLVLLLIPLGGRQPALLALVAAVADPILHSL